MSWQYGLVRSHNRITDDEFYSLEEIYGRDCHTEDLTIGGNSPSEVIGVLKQMIYDLENNLLIIDKESSSD
jgi:hypothetical protein